MVSLREELPPEGDEQEARELVRRHPVRLPSYKLERVHVAILNVDYAPPNGSGYARPLSRYRVAQLRRDWDPLAVSPLTISRREDNTLWVIDGNHRRFVGYEKGYLQMPAMVHSGLERAQEARLYTALGTVLGQTPWTRFLAKLAADDDDARELTRIAMRYGLEINGGYGKSDGKIQAVARVEWILARGGSDALNWVFGVLNDAFGGERDSLGAEQLEGVYNFYVRYADLVDRDEVARFLTGSGVDAWFNRAAAINQRVDMGHRANTYGLAIAEIVNEAWRRQGVKVKDLLPAWEKIGQFGSRYREVTFADRSTTTQWRTSGARSNWAPQQLSAGQ